MSMKAESTKEISIKKVDYSKTEARLKSVVATCEQRIAKSRNSKEKLQAESDEAKAKSDLKRHQVTLSRISTGTTKEQNHKTQLKTNLELLEAQAKAAQGNIKVYQEKAKKLKVTMEKLQKSTAHIRAEALDSKKEDDPLAVAKEAQEKAEFKRALKK